MWVLRPESRCVNVRMSLHQVFYQLKTPDCSLASVLSSCSVFQREMALAACSALIPHLAVLTSSGINSLTLRISTQADMVIKNQTFVKVFRISSSISSVPFDKGVVSVSVLALRWSTRLAPEAGSSLSATWTSWTALWSPSSMEVALVCRRLPWTWSSSSTSHTPSNAHADHDTLKVLKKKNKSTEQKVVEHRERSWWLRRDRQFCTVGHAAGRRGRAAAGANVPALRWGCILEGCKLIICEGTVVCLCVSCSPKLL